ncbi:RadC family protein [Haliangium sp.]
MFETPERPRERLLAYGGDRVSTVELLAMVLGTGIRGLDATTLAARLIGNLGGLVGLARAAPRELADLPGIGVARATRIASAFHLGRRALEAGMLASDIIHTSEDLHGRLRLRMAGLTQEVFVVIALDPRNAVLDEIEIARGGLTSVEVHPRDVFRPLIRRSAAAAVVAHNHPSGSHLPSSADVAVTHRLREAGKLLGIPILDHLVFGNGLVSSVYEYTGLREPHTPAFVVERRGFKA